MRIAVLLSGLLFAGCTVGEVGNMPSNNNSNTGVDAGTPDSAPTGNTNGCVEKVLAADAHIHAGNTTNAGTNCIVAGCHLNNSLGAGATGWQFAGTVYIAGTTNP